MFFRGVAPANSISEYMSRMVMCIQISITISEYILHIVVGGINNKLHYGRRSILEIGGNSDVGVISLQVGLHMTEKIRKKDK